MNDEDVLGTVRDAMTGVHMRTPVQALVAAGRSRRRRRIGGVAAGAALATGLALTPAIGSPQVNAPPVATGNEVHMHLAAFSVDTNPDGTVTVKLTKSESLDPEIMQRTLAQAGIPAQITINKWCGPSDPSQNLTEDFEKVIGEANQPAEPPATVNTPSAQDKKAKLEKRQDLKKQENSEKPETIEKLHEQPDGRAMLVITPSAMPPATKLVIGMRTPDYQPDSPSSIAVMMSLVPNDAPLTCSTDVPVGPPRESSSTS
ncbi:hypothetical protein GCM10022226_38800 [Sphaerisporangium flaviroseum]|uniref:Uncharacterized protein n=1 Tax=Sphaerisporangium flaviroseum TaxID=509199 RepID=A0ABP7IB67_9ACTN